MKKLKSKKGMSLIELLVSLVIISISILTISSIVRIGINTNKRSEIKQQGLILGEQILEEINLLGLSNENVGNITYSNIELPISGDFIGKSDNEVSKNTLVYNSKIDIKGIEYDVEITLNKNESIEFHDNLNLDLTLDFITEETNNGYSISIFKGNEKIKGNINPDSISIKVINDNKEQPNKVYINDKNETSTPAITFVGDKLMLNFTNDYKHEDGINIDFYNNLLPKLDLYIQKSSNCKEIVNIHNQQGNLNILDNLIDYNESKIQNLYEIKIAIKNNQKVLFEGYANKNLEVKYK